MDRRGGCCIARYANGADYMSKVDRIMLKFRPIAPKPVPGAGTASEGSSSESSDAFSKIGRVKRKYVRDNNNNTNTANKRKIRRRNIVSSPKQKKHPVPMVTLPLLPETPDPKDSPARDLTLTASKELRNNMNRNSHAMVEPEPYWYCGGRDQAVGATSYSCVTVECVMDASVEGEGLGNTDEERRVKLSKDTCPGFISDGYGRVTWTNGAYREMVGQEGVLLVAMKMKMSAVVPYTYPSFTCRVRVVQYDASGKERNSLTVPCDVWRMDSGGFAWRLDVKAALSLSLAY